MAPNIRSNSLKFEQAPNGGWRFIESGIARLLTTVELNEFAHNFAQVRGENEALEREKSELEAAVALKEVIP
jgi:hypothetical protein